MLNVFGIIIKKIKTALFSESNEDIILKDYIRDFVLAKDIYQNVNLLDALSLKNTYTYLIQLKERIIIERFETLSNINKSHYNAMIRELSEMQDNLLNYNVNIATRDYLTDERMSEYFRKMMKRRLNDDKRCNIC